MPKPAAARKRKSDEGASSRVVRRKVPTTQRRSNGSDRLTQRRWKVLQEVCRSLPANDAVCHRAMLSAILSATHTSVFVCACGTVDCLPLCLMCAPVSISVCLCLHFHVCPYLSPASSMPLWLSFWLSSWLCLYIQPSLSEQSTRRWRT